MYSLFNITTMAVKPLSRRKIVKKITKTANRFQSHLYMRVSVSYSPERLICFADFSQKSQRY